MKLKIILSEYNILNHLFICIIGMVKNTQSLFEKANLEIALVVLNVSVDIKPFIEKGEVKVHVYK